MLSQLCKAKPFWTLNPKIQQLQHTSASACQTCVNHEKRDQSLPSGEENRCQLIHCSYCDYRACCPVSSCENLHQREEPQPDDNSYQVTENPAYGLSSKLWLECELLEDAGDQENYEKETEEQCEENKQPLATMSHLNISSSCLLESIPESKEITTKESNCNNLQEKYNKPGNRKDRYSWTKLDTAENLEDAISYNKYSMERKNCDISCDNSADEINQLSGQSADAKVTNSKQKTNVKDKPFSLSLIKPHLRSNEVKQGDLTLNSLQSKTKNETSRFRKFPNNVKDRYMFGNSRQLKSSNVLGHDKLSEITSVKTEESIQEWLMRISDWVDNNSWIKDDENIPEKSQEFNDETNFSTEDGGANIESRTQTSADQSSHEIKRDIFEDILSETSTVNALSKATKESPANIPMVVMQCSRLHSHITSKPPFQQTSLPMGTLVTALYQESDWLYVQTPHGVEGFVTSSNCVPIGTVQGTSQPKRPWEPCDFPIQISIRNPCDFGQMHGTFVPAKLPTSGGKRPGPFVSMVKMKTNLYSDRYFNNTFKHKDSIKTAKTVTDILRSSPEMEINRQ